MSDRQTRIVESIQNQISCLELWIENESHGHGLNRGVVQPETHFKVLIVSNDFVGKTRLDRQRWVNDLLKSEFQHGLHALTQRLLTAEEWAVQSTTIKSEFKSPLCHSK